MIRALSELDESMILLAESATAVSQSIDAEACLWAILTFTPMEMLVLMLKCKERTMVFKSHTDDTFTI